MLIVRVLLRHLYILYLLLVMVMIPNMITIPKEIREDFNEKSRV